jgi:hypothetical protein
MLARPVTAVSFEVTTRTAVAYRGTSADDVGSWNAGYRAVYQLSFSGPAHPGPVPGQGSSPAAAVSPAFTIGTDPSCTASWWTTRCATSPPSGTGRTSSTGPRPPARQPDRRERLRLRGPGLRQQRQPARHAEEDRRAGRRVRRLVRRRRRLREVRLHRQLRRRADADRGARLPRQPTRRCSRRRSSGCSGSPSCGTPCSKVLYARSGSATATRPATRSRATTTSGSCPSKRTA